MIDYPVAEVIQYNQTINNNQLSDDYNWLRDSNWPDVSDQKIIDYLTAENSYCQSYMAEHLRLQDQIYKEIIGRIKLSDITLPIKIDDYYYYQRTEEQSNYKIFCRKYKSLDHDEEIILDENLLAYDQKFFSLGGMSVSEDHNLIAYATDITGAEYYTILVKDLVSDTLLSDKIENTINDIVWDNSSKGFYYSKLDANWRSLEIYYHLLGTSQLEDSLIIKENDLLFSLSIEKVNSKKFAIITSSSKDSNEQWFIDLDQSNVKPTLILARRPDHKYYTDHHDNHFYITTNDLGKNFRLIKTSIADLAPKNWQQLIAHDPSSFLTSVECYNNFLIVSSKNEGLPIIKIFDYLTENYQEVKFPDAAYQASLQYTDYHDELVRISYSSLTKPATIYGYNNKNSQLVCLKVTEIPSGHDDKLYRSERVYATAEDGSKIPVSLVYRIDKFKHDGSNPLYQYGYGSYGIAMPLHFRSSIISLLDRGFVYAIAHIRGGSDMGYEWYEQAKYLNKKLTFSDFINCSEYLVKNNYTKTGNITVMGGSAGGMLMGNIINQRPELYKAVVAHVPFVDVLNTMLDETLPLTPGEYKEWGNPKDPQYFDYIKSYCPYQNVTKQAYPALYVTCGISDPRVTYWEAAKWVAKIRANKTDENILLLETNMEAGHLGNSGRFGYIKDIAKEFSFILSIYGIR